METSKEAILESGTYTYIVKELKVAGKVFVVVTVKKHLVPDEEFMMEVNQPFK